MHERKNSPGSGRFEEKLAELRLRIDLLPEEQRPRLFELADVVEQQHRKLHHTTLRPKQKQLSH